MQIDLRNTLTLLSRFFTERTNPNELLPNYLEWAESEHGIITILNEIRVGQRYQDFDILSAARSDGIDILEAQQQYGLFNPTRSIEATKWCFDESHRLMLQERIKKTLEMIAKTLPSSLLPERLVVVTLPADCANGTLMLNGSGISCYGRSPGYLFLRVWPTTSNLNRLDYILARSFIHGIRKNARNVDSRTSLGEAMVLEGLAAAFIKSVFSDIKHPGLIGFMPPDNWEETLANVAGYYSKIRYDDVMINIYGSQIHAGRMRPPIVVPLTREELDYVYELMIAQTDCMEAHIVAAYLYGDPLMAAQGHPSFGIPHLAGFEVGYHVVERYLQATGIKVASALSLPWRDFFNVEGL